MKEIITDYEKLSHRSDEVDFIKQNKLIKGVTFELQQRVEADNLPALAAINLGLPYRIFIINFNGTIRTFINPIITANRNYVFSKETNPSIPDKKYIVGRYNDIDVMYTDPKGNVQSKTLIGLAAFLYQQMMHELEGVLISDLGLEIDDDFEHASEEEQTEIIKMWASLLDEKVEENQIKINEDPNLKKLQDAVKFMEGYYSGDVNIEGTISVDKPKKTDEESNDEQ